MAAHETADWVPNLAALGWPALGGNLRAWWRPYGEAPGCLGEDGPDFAWMSTGIDDRHLNRVLVARLPPAELRPAIRRLIDLRHRAGAATTWWLARGDATPEAGAMLLTEFDARSLETIPAMAVELDCVKLTEPPPGLVITEAENLVHRQVWAMTSANAAAWTPAAVEGFARIESSYGSEIYRNRPRYLGWYKGAPVATAAMAVGAGVAGLYIVATLPGFQRLGIGSALVSFALRDAARRGAKVAILQASDQGEPVYRRMGFETVGWYDRFETGGK